MTDQAAKVGRPTVMTDEVRDTILRRLMDGETIRAICRDPAMPARSTIHLALANDKVFSDLYGKACEVRNDEMFDELLEIADDGSNDWMERHDSEGGNIGWKENGEAIRRSVLRVDTRKWVLSKMQPRKYGDKIAVGGADDLPPVQVEMNDVELARRVAFVLQQGIQKGSSNGESG